jgi:putative ABC transport system permease protein
VIDLDSWQEIGATLRKNPLRTALTGLGVFLGIFILLLMVGFGQALGGGIRGQMSGFATNAVFIWGERTSKPYAGLPPYRPVSYDNSDVDVLARLPGVAHLAPRNQLGGFMQGSNVRWGVKTGSFVTSTAETAVLSRSRTAAVSVGTSSK